MVLFTSDPWIVQGPKAYCTEAGEGMAAIYTRACERDAVQLEGSPLLILHARSSHTCAPASIPFRSICNPVPINLAAWLAATTGRTARE
jgi:hypothetical protein